jgi:hypothetical protein
MLTLPWAILSLDQLSCFGSHDEQPMGDQSMFGSAEREKYGRVDCGLLFFRRTPVRSELGVSRAFFLIPKGYCLTLPNPNLVRLEPVVFFYCSFLIWRLMQFRRYPWCHIVSKGAWTIDTFGMMSFSRTLSKFLSVKISSNSVSGGLVSGNGVTEYARTMA